MAGLSEIVATSHEYREKSLADACADNDPLLFHLKKLGRMTTVNGGYQIWEDILPAQNQYYQAIDATEEITIGYNQTISGFQYSPKIGVVPVIITALERAQNQGQAQFKNLLKTRMMVADDTFSNNLESDLQGDGTGRGGKAFAGIKACISKTPTVGSVGGISRSTYSSIQNVAVDATTLGGGGATSSANIESRLRYARNLLVRNTDSPSLCLSGTTHYNAAGDAMAGKQRYIKDETMAKAGFDNIAIEGMAMVLANGLVFSGLTRISATDSYLINPETFALRMYQGFNMQPMPERYSVNQLVDVALIVGIGNLTTNNPGMNGVLYG